MTRPCRRLLVMNVPCLAPWTATGRNHRLAARPIRAAGRAQHFLQRSDNRAPRMPRQFACPAETRPAGFRVHHQAIVSRTLPRPAPASGHLARDRPTIRRTLVRPSVSSTVQIGCWRSAVAVQAHQAAGAARPCASGVVPPTGSSSSACRARREPRRRRQDQLTPSPRKASRATRPAADTPAPAAPARRPWSVAFAARPPSSRWHRARNSSRHPAGPRRRPDAQVRRREAQSADRPRPRRSTLVQCRRTKGWRPGDGAGASGVADSATGPAATLLGPCCAIARAKVGSQPAPWGRPDAPAANRPALGRHFGWQLGGLSDDRLPARSAAVSRSPRGSLAASVLGVHVPAVGSRWPGAPMGQGQLRDGLHVGRLNFASALVGGPGAQAALHTVRSARSPSTPAARQRSLSACKRSSAMRTCGQQPSCPRRSAPASAASASAQRGAKPSGSASNARRRRTASARSAASVRSATSTTRPKRSSSCGRSSPSSGIHRADQQETGRVAQRQALALHAVDAAGRRIQQHIHQMIRQQVDLVDVEDAAVGGGEQARFKARSPRRAFSRCKRAEHAVLGGTQRQFDQGHRTFDDGERPPAAASPE